MNGLILSVARLKNWREEPGLLNRALKLCDGLRQSSFLLIGSARKIMRKPVGRVELDTTTQLLNRLRDGAGA